MKILLTGASGIIGQAAMKALLQHGHSVRGLRHAAELSPRTAEVRSGGLEDPKALLEASDGVDAIVHAARLHRDDLDRMAHGQVNAAGMQNLVAVARKAGVPRIVFISSADVTLHRGERDGWDEDRVPAGGPLGAFGQTMLEAEATLIGATDIASVILRHATLWGNPQGRNVAEVFDPRGIDLFGSGKTLLSTTHVDNLAHAAALALDSSAADHSCLHVLDGELISTGEFYTGLAQALRASLPRISRLPWANLSARLKSEPSVARRAFSSALDGRKAHQLLGYEPIVGIEQGLTLLSDDSR